jgi:hypothetical protein
MTTTIITLYAVALIASTVALISAFARYFETIISKKINVETVTYVIPIYLKREAAYEGLKKRDVSASIADFLSEVESEEEKFRTALRAELKKLETKVVKAEPVEVLSAEELEVIYEI